MIRSNSALHYCKGSADSSGEPLRLALSPQRSQTEGEVKKAGRYCWMIGTQFLGEESMRSLKLMGEEVLPAVREIGKELDLNSPFEVDPATNLPVLAPAD